MKKDIRFAGIIGFGFMVVLVAFTIWGTTNRAVESGATEGETVSIDTAGAEGIKEASKIVNSEGVATGYTVVATQPGFYGSQITITLTYEQDATTIKSVEIDASNETQGVGSKVAEEEFTSQFVGITTPVQIADEGEGTKVDAVSQATVSSKAVAAGINKASKFLQDNK